MTKISSLAVAILLGLCLLVPPAQAQLARTFVSSLGNDANDCGRLTPCRTFQIAHNNTLPAGEITVLDPGGYGAVTITKGISIINDGVGEAGALVSGGLNGITINAGANDRITLRGITVKGIGFGGGNGIVFQSGRFLSIENCVVRNLTGTAQNQFIGYGIIFNSNSASELAVSNTVVTDNEGHGISVVPSFNARVLFSSVQVYKNGLHGIVLATNGALVQGTADNSISSFNGFSGFAVEGNGPTSLMVSRSVATSNGTAFSHLSGSGTLRVSRSNIAYNNATWTGSVASYGDNDVRGNGDGDIAAPLGIVTKK